MSKKQIPKNKAIMNYIDYYNSSSKGMLPKEWRNPAGGMENTIIGTLLYGVDKLAKVLSGTFNNIFRLNKPNDNNKAEFSNLKAMKNNPTNGHDRDAA